MFALTVTYGPRATQDTLYFKTQDAADMVRVTALTDPHASLDDDFGKSLHVFGDVHSLCTFSIEKALDISAEQSLMGMRAQAKAQQKANSDPMLRLLGGAVGGGQMQRA